MPNVAHEVEINTEQKTEQKIEEVNQQKTSSLESSETDFSKAASQRLESKVYLLLDI